MRNALYDWKWISGYSLVSLAFVSAVGFAATNGLQGHDDRGELRGAAPVEKSDAAVNHKSPADRMANRMNERLLRNNVTSPGVGAMSRALKDRDALLKKEIAIKLQTPQGLVDAGTLSIDGKWLKLETSLFSAHYEVDADLVKIAIEKGELTISSAALPVVVQSTFVDGKKVTRAHTNGIAKPGYVIDAAEAAAAIAKAFGNNAPEAVIQTQSGKPSVAMTMPDGSIKTLELLSTGMSDYSNSSEDRIWNVRKAFDERLNNIIIKNGETFSIVAALDAPITLEKGWREEMGLFGGGAAKTPGAGICQSATTLYRAALLAGLPIVYKRNHSLLVDHYEQYGIGLDATVFPGVHDLQFRNDTGHDILLQAYLEPETETGYMHMYGISDGRTATLDGPYFMGTKNRPAELRPLGTHDIGWTRTVTKADGSEETLPIIAHFAKPLWRAVIAKYSQGNGMEMVHGAAL